VAAFHTFYRSKDDGPLKPPRQSADAIRRTACSPSIDAVDSTSERLRRGGHVGIVLPCFNEEDQAAETFAAILEEDPDNADAYGGLIRAHLALGDVNRADELAASAPAGLTNHQELTTARAMISLMRQATQAGYEQVVAAAQAGFTHWRNVPASAAFRCGFLLRY
jgi:hypothetical protein